MQDNKSQFKHKWISILILLKVMEYIKFKNGEQGL